MPRYRVGLPIGYLVSVVPVAVGTLCALAPLRRPPRALRALSFRLGVVLNELPFIAFLWLLAATALALDQRDIDSAGGWAVLGLAVVTMVGLSVVARRGLRAGPAVDHALTEGLGAGWRTAIDVDLAARLRRRLPFARIAFGPFFVRRGDVKRVANVSYGDGGEENLLDLYLHRSRPSGGPTLIYFHGGGYFGGSKNREARPLLYRLASQGWVCISAHYRLRPAASFRDHLIDVKQAIAWVRDHAHEYGADPAVLFVAGSSAGGHLASVAALTPRDPALQPGFEGGGSPTLRREAVQHVVQPGRLRRAARGTALVRPLSLHPLRHGRGWDRGLRRVGAVDTDDLASEATMNLRPPAPRDRARRRSRRARRRAAAGSRAARGRDGCRRPAASS